MRPTHWFLVCCTLGMEGDGGLAEESAGRLQLYLVSRACSIMR